MVAGVGSVVEMGSVRPDVTVSNGRSGNPVPLPDVSVPKVRQVYDMYRNRSDSMPVTSRMGSWLCRDLCLDETVRT